MDLNEIDEHVTTHTDSTGNVVGLDDKGVICRVYIATRPILLFAKTFLFFKPKWQAVLTVFINTLDEQCHNDVAIP